MLYLPYISLICPYISPAADRAQLADLDARAADAAEQEA